MRRDSEHPPARRDSEMLTQAVDNMREDVRRHMESAKSYEDPHESLLSGRQPYFSNINLDTPLSPRQPPQDDRHPSLHAIPPRPVFKPPPQSTHFSNSPRRYGSIGTNPGTTTGNHSPNFHRSLQHPAPAVQPQPMPVAHRLASVTSPDGPNLPRRHTAADIRVPGWTTQSGSPFGSGQSSSNWPSSPHQTPSASDQHVRDVLASYELGAPRKQPPPPPQPQSWQQQSMNYGPNQTTPPLTTSNDTTPSTLSVESGWSFSGGGKLPNTRHLVDSAPQTRRSSMASNVHSLLNPAETVERDEDDCGGEERKRKRVG